MTIQFDLHKLGWNAFQDLAATILREVMGQTLQVFAPGHDGGRDAVFHGDWKPNNNTVLVGNFTIQCKHTSKANNSLTVDKLKTEFPKIKRLVAQGLVDNYILVTNHILSGVAFEEIQKKITSLGIKNVVIFGSTWVEGVIAENPKLRRLVPRIYGLGDLTQIVTHQAFQQAISVIESIAPDLACFVPTEAYRKCAKALTEHGFVLLLGEPASGKTMIANLMALSAADEWDMQTLILSAPEDLTKLWNPQEPKQFLWVDDAFGATQYDSNRVKEWNQRLPSLKAAIKQGARVIFTSRDYIFKYAKEELKISGFELFDDSRVIIEVEKLSESERQQILYNHVKLGNQPKDFRTQVKSYLNDAAKTPRFLPEIARRFGNKKFTQKFSATKEGVLDFFANPTSVIEDLIGSLSPNEKAAIALLFINGGSLSIPLKEDKATLSTIAMMESTPGKVKTALKSLADSLLKLVHQEKGQCWQFRHPTIQDAFASYVAVNPELIDIYLSGVKTDRLMREVTCGNMHVQGAKIIIPHDRFDGIIERLKKIPPSQYPWSNPVREFLANRCSVDFLLQYFSEVENVAALPEGIRFYLGPSDTNIKILKRLRDDNKLDEEIRLEVIAKVRAQAFEYHSTKFITSSALQGLITEVEKESLLNELSDNLFSNLEDIVDELKDGWENDSDPDDVFSDITSSLEYFTTSSDSEIASKAEYRLYEVRSVIEELNEKYNPQSSYDPLITGKAPSVVSNAGRSIFDDIDR
ncbi:MAG: restriction endonuclease [Pseudomonadota bacterium]